MLYCALYFYVGATWLLTVSNAGWLFLFLFSLVGWANDEFLDSRDFPGEKFDGIDVRITTFMGEGNYGRLVASLRRTREVCQKVDR